MRASISLGLLLVIAVSISNGFRTPSPSIAVRPSTSLRASTDEILAAYQKKIKVKPVIESIKAPVVDKPAPVVVDTQPPAVIDINTAPVIDTTPATDPLSKLWSQITDPFKSLPDPFESMKIPKEPFKDVDVNVDLQSVKAAVPDTLKESFKSVSVPDLKSVDIKESFKSVSVPDIKESLKSVSVPDIKESIKSVDLKTVTESVKNIQLPTPPERPDGAGVILPDGGRLPTVLDLWNNGPFASASPNNAFSHWKDSIAGLFETMRVAEFGAWYVAGLCLVAWQVQVNNKERQFVKELKTAELKAKQAADAATLAAEGATEAKNMAAKEKSAAKSTETVLSDSKMHAMELEKQAMKKELETLQQQTEDLKKQLKAATASTADVNGAVEAPPASAPKSAPKKVAPRDSKEDKRVLEIIKEKDIANASAATATATKPKKAVKKKAAKKAPAKKAAPKKVIVKKAEKVVAKKKDDVVVVEMEEELVPAEAKDVFFANATAPATAKPKKKKAAATKKKAAPKKVAAAAHSSDNPWSSLSQSTLKRKTVKELSAYLSERDVQVTNDAGKPKKKADLVEAVLSL